MRRKNHVKKLGRNEVLEKQASNTYSNMKLEKIEQKRVSTAAVVLDRGMKNYKKKKSAPNGP